MEASDKRKIGSSVKEVPFRSHQGMHPCLPWQPLWLGKAARQGYLSSWLSGSPNFQGKGTSWPVGSKPRMMRLAV